MSEPVAPVEVEQQLSDLPAAQPYNAPVHQVSEPTVTHPPEYQPTPPPQPAPVYNPLSKRYHDPVTNKIVKSPEAPTPPGGAAVDAVSPGDVMPPPAPQQPIQHSPLLLHLAQQYGIPPQVVAQTPSDQLRADLALLQQIQAQQVPQQQQPVAPPPEPPIDWGVNPETKEPYKESDYPPHIVRMVKDQRELAKRLEALEQNSQHFAQTVQQREYARAHQTSVQQLQGLMSQYPDVFGQAGNATPEQQARQQMMYSQLQSLCQARQQTTLENDFARFLPAFVQQTQPHPSRITPDQWQQAGLAQTVHRNTAPVAKSRRQQIAERIDDELRRNGIKVGATPSSNLSDLPPR